jgi:hypothetical protein
MCARVLLYLFLARCTMHYLFCTRGAWSAAEPADRSSSSSSIRAVLGGRPSSSRTMWRIASSSRSSESMVSRSRMWLGVNAQPARRNSLGSSLQRLGSLSSSFFGREGRRQRG